MHLELSREGKEDDREVGESQAELDYGIVSGSNSCEAGNGYFKGV